VAATSEDGTVSNNGAAGVPVPGASPSGGPAPGGPAPGGTAHQVRQLGWLLAWAVVFCDIGTSVYYTPGILYHRVGNLAPFFIGLVTLAFLLLAQKYTEVSWRNPEGGGVVTVARKAFGPWWGAFGGILITIDYFLTSSISSVSGFSYLASVFPHLRPDIELLSCIGIGLLCLLNIVGIRESATVAVVMAIASLVTSVVTAIIGLAGMKHEEIAVLTQSLGQFKDLPLRTVLIGFAGSWLAFSGLESISQLSPTMARPLKTTARRTMMAVIITIVLTSPILTALSVSVLPPAMKAASTDTFISDLARIRGGVGMEIAVVISASALLLFAANTAMIGGYHVFLALSRDRFFPRILARRNKLFSTPHWAILITTVVPILTIVVTRAKLTLLGDMYSFGLLGAFTFTSLGLDVLRWREGNRGGLFWVGVFTTLMVAGSWAVNIVEKPFATAYGGGLAVAGLFVSLAIRRNWIINLVNRIPWVHRRAEEIRRRVEYEVEEHEEIVGIEGAVAMKALYHSSTLVAVLGTNPKLMSEAIRRCRGMGESAIYLVSVTEWPGMFSGAENHPSPEQVTALNEMGHMAREAGIFAIPIWGVSDVAYRLLADASLKLNCSCVMIGTSQRSALYHMLRGNVLHGLARRLPEGHTIIAVG
jgi:amino acid transporter